MAPFLEGSLQQCLIWEGLLRVAGR